MCKKVSWNEAFIFKQIAAPDHARDYVGGVDGVVRPGEFLAADEYRS